MHSPSTANSLSAPSRHGEFACQTEFAHFPNLDLFFLSTKSLQHLQLTPYLALVPKCWTCQRKAMGLPHLLARAAGYRWLPLAKAILDVEAVSPRGAKDRRVLTADVDAGLMTCVRR